MTRAALRGLLQRKLRALLTAFAVVLGVAMISGTLMLTDSIEGAFDTVFETSYEGTDAVVSGRPIVEGATSGDPMVSETMLPTIRALPGVDAAAGGIGGDFRQTSLSLATADGRAFSSGAGQTLAVGVDPEHPRFIPLELEHGAWPHDAEIVLDAGTVDQQHLAVGDTVTVTGDGGSQPYRLAGVGTFGDVGTLGATVAIFDLPTAQRLLRKDGVDSISVAAKPGTPVDALVRQIEPVLPATLQVESSSARATEAKEEVSKFVGYLRWALLAFGGIALFVGAFVIFNTLSITIAQRTRELATLRTLGASRRQVLRSVLVETLAIGVLASLTGLALGVGLARGLSTLFGAMGLELPHADLVLAPRTIVASLSVGIVVTVLAGLMPAIRATRVAPIAAVREGAAPPPSRLARQVPVIAGLVLAASGALLGFGLFAGGLDVAGRLGAIAVGTVGAFIAVGMLAPRLVRPLAAFVGWPSSRMGAAGALARRNAVRQPGRTAASAAALMIGLALVTTVAVLGEGLRTSARDSVARQIQADYVLSSADGSTVSSEIGGQVASLPGVTSSSVRSDKALAADANTTVTGVDPATIGTFYRFHYSAGAADAVASLVDGGAIVRRSFAEAHDLQVADQLPVTTPSGVKLDLKVSAILDPGSFDLDPLLGSVVIDQALFDASFPRPSDAYTFANVDASAGALASTAIAEGTERYPGLNVETGDEFVESRASGLDQILNLLYVLLGLSVVVSLFGMVNTLVLAVFERTRELGMLRAIGLTRRQTRSTVRHESVITALIGAALGLPLGIGLAALVVFQGLSDQGIAFALPVTTLAAFVAVAIVAGVIAAIVPARRAGRLNVLQALQYE